MVPPACNGPNRQLRLPGRADLARYDHVEIEVERNSDLVADHHTAARNRKNEAVGPRVLRKRNRKLSPSLFPILKRRDRSGHTLFGLPQSRLVSHKAFGATSGLSFARLVAYPGKIGFIHC